MSENNETQNQAPKAAAVNIRLTPVANSDQPVLANFTRLNGARGIVFIDFGFLEPGALTALSQIARTGGTIPETLAGKLAVRVALGYDTLTGLHEQLAKAIAGLKANPVEKTATVKKTTKH